MTPERIAELRGFVSGHLGVLAVTTKDVLELLDDAAERDTLEQAHGRAVAEAFTLRTRLSLLESAARAVVEWPVDLRPAIYALRAALGDGGVK